PRRHPPERRPRQGGAAAGRRPSSGAGRRGAWYTGRVQGPGVRAMSELGRRLTAEVLEPMKAAFVGKDEVIDLLGVCLVAGENLFLLGPPGTAKSALVLDLGRGLQGRVFDYLLTRFTEPNELFGPFDIRKLREGDLVTNTE